MTTLDELSHSGYLCVQRAVCLCGLILVACAPSTVSGTGAAESGTEGETGEPAVDFLWTFGGDSQPVLSAPVSDVTGNIFVLVAMGATPVDELFSQGNLDVDAVALASLSSAGETRWIVPLFGPAELWPSAPVRPVVGPAGDVWVHYGDELIRVGSDGVVKWRTKGITAGDSWVESRIRLALSMDATCFVLALTWADMSDPWQSLRAIDADGVERWRADVGLPAEISENQFWPPTLTDAPLVTPDGNALVGCDICMPGRIGLAQWAASDGLSNLFFSIPSTPSTDKTQYHNLRWDGTAIRFHWSFSEFGDSYHVSFDGSGGETTEAPTVFASWGSAWVPPDSVTRSSFSVQLDAEQVLVDVTGTPLADEIARAVEPVALVEPPAIVIAAELSDFDASGLILVGTDGQVILTAKMSRRMDPIPAIGNGFVAYVEPETQRLVAIEAPVERVADGPWPIMGGDPQGTRSTEGK